MNYLLIGKPNVGKSSIFNILTGLNTNIIHSDAGTTRDWHYDKIKGTSSYAYDTPGILIKDSNNKKNIISTDFNKIIINKINHFLYVIDYKDLFNNIDKTAITHLRKFNKNITLIINKYDNFNLIHNPEINKYGIKDIIFLSCTHRLGFNKLQSKIESLDNLNHEDNNEIIDFSIAIFGKPNVGKSTFLNTVLGYKRSNTSSEAGTTSDYVYDIFNYKKKNFKIIDTAGIGKKSNIIDSSINFYSIKKSFKNINKVDSAIIIFDANEGLNRQDKRIINMIAEKAKSIIFIFNKIDLIIDKKLFKSNITNDIKYSFNEIKNIKIFFISSLINNHVLKILDYLYSNIYKSEHKINTSQLNIWLKNTTKENSHPLIEGKKINFKYAVIINDKPVTIKIFCNYADKIKNSYKRYLINTFNKNFKILNQKTKIIFSSVTNPYI